MWGGGVEGGGDQSIKSQVVEGLGDPPTVVSICLHHVSKFTGINLIVQFEAFQ